MGLMTLVLLFEEPSIIEGIASNEYTSHIAHNGGRYPVSRLEELHRHVAQAPFSQ